MPWPSGSIVPGRIEFPACVICIHQEPDVELSMLPEQAFKTRNQNLLVPVVRMLPARLYAEDVAAAFQHDFNHTHLFQ